MDQSVLCVIPIFKINDNWQGVLVRTIDDETFHMETYAKDLIFKDEELKTDENGKVIIDLEPLKLKMFYRNFEVPKTFEMPADILAARKEKRRLKALAKNAVYIDGTKKPMMYFYIEEGKLRILQGEKEAIAEEILKIHNRKAVSAESLDLGHPYLELPAEVSMKFENALQEKRLRNLALVPAGQSLLNGFAYYRLNMEITSHMWEMVKTLFENFGTEGDMNGFLTCQPARVAEILGIPKK